MFELVFIEGFEHGSYDFLCVVSFEDGICEVEGVRNVFGFEGFFNSFDDSGFFNFENLFYAWEFSSYNVCFCVFLNESESSVFRWGYECDGGSCSSCSSCSSNSVGITL